MIHYYDTDAHTWRAIQNPSLDDIKAILAAAATNKPCTSCDADVEFLPGDGCPAVVILHADDCPDRAA